MRPEDFVPRGHFRRWFLHRSVDDPRRILFMKPSSPGKAFSFPVTAMFERMKIRVLRGYGFQQRYSINMRVGFLDGRVILDTLFHLISRVTRTSFSLNTYCSGSCKMYHCMCVKSCGFSMTAQHLLFLLQSEVIWINDLAKVIRSWWPDFSANTFARLDSARLLRV